MSLLVPTIKDSGVRENFDTGSRRDSRSGKGRYDLLPCRALRALSKHFEGGAIKYDARNWEKGQPLSRYVDSALRHLFNHLEGMRDEDHAAAAAWNVMAMMDTKARIDEGLLPKELDDLPLPVGQCAGDPPVSSKVAAGPLPSSPARLEAYRKAYEY